MTYLQYVGDNTDHDVAIIDGKNTHHSLGNIAMTNWRFSNLNTRKNLLPEEKKQVLSDIESTQVIPTKNYHAQGKPALNQIVLHPVV